MIFANYSVLLILHLQFNRTDLCFYGKHKDKDHQQPLPIPEKKQTKLLVNANLILTLLLNELKCESFLVMQMRERDNNSNITKRNVL